MTRRILVTGSSGLVGTALSRLLSATDVVVPFDLRGAGHARGDTRDLDAVRAAACDCDGIVHLAAVSRVVWGERDPQGCEATNVVGTRNVLSAAIASPRKPWVVFASSREVYGQPPALPVTEDAPLAPLNVYGRSKVEGERLTIAAREGGIRTAVVRLSNVYGSAADHADRVVPAFARAAIAGARLRVDGSSHTFDFVHIDDAVRGLAALLDLVEGSHTSPPHLHLVTGQPTTLGELAHLAVACAGSRAPIDEAPARDFDVARFYGSPARARELLGWTSQVTIREGLARLVRDLREVPEVHDARSTRPPRATESRELG